MAYARVLAAESAARPKGERTRARLLIAACTVLDAEGPQGLSIAAIARAAGLAKGTAYIYFPDLAALLTELLTGFARFVRSCMHQAGRDDPIRDATRAYIALFRENRGLMRCLVHHLDGFPEAQAAFQRLNRDWLETVVAATERKRHGVPHDELMRRAYALGGMVDQYLSSLYLSRDPALVALSRDEAAVLDTLSLIWKRGMTA
ncbi:TetR family transcriptional regulator [Rhodovulum iodosum]|nr:TetR family transcriptional regulator [Rhodovulum robiginosum]